MPDSTADNQTYAALAYVGALPFLACAVLPWLGVAALPVVGDLPYAAAAYGLAIASFLAGAHWGLHLARRGDAGTWLLFTSNVITVAAWVVFLLSPVAVSLAGLAGAFLGLLGVDVRLNRLGLLPAGYLRTRRNVTLVVVAALLLTMAAA